MHQIDASFKQQKEQAARRRRRERWRRWGFAGAVAVALAAGFVVITYDQWSIEWGGEDYGEPGLVEDDVVPTPAYVPAIVDLAGDPMIINIGGGAGEASAVRPVSRPETLAEPGIPDQIFFLADTMLSSSERFMTTLPSSQEDFAFFQAQRAPAPASADAEPEPEPAEVGLSPDAELAEFEDAAAGWGETVGEGQAELPEFKRTRIENTTSVALVIREVERYQPTEDVLVKVISSRTLDSLVMENRFSAEDARLAGEALKAIFGRETLEPGYVVALRGFRDSASLTALRLMQVSIYDTGGYVGTLARNDEGSFVEGSDPWVDEDLFHYSGEPEATVLQQQYRLLDAIYSTAARNSVPTGVIGEAIMLLSRSHDLSAFANRDDRFVLVYSDQARDGAMGRVLYIAVHGKEKSIECFVYRPQSGGDFSCMTENSQVLSLTVMNGMVTPVDGVMKSTFGPRKHPILKTVRIHKGVDWAAPVGTPVFAAFDGEVTYAGDGDDYGNLVRIKHEDGRETRYAHLDRFDAKAKPGTQVKAGDVIGYVGTTGLSTGPHLHFELYSGGEAVDPLQAIAAVTSDGSAADILTDQIIRVESGGNAAAKNPLSSATGLGQFIDSTWLRMMRTYRPDLARSLSREDQLALRFDPTISREMVRHLAHEGEAYLRARGHQITAGRLYLCHFLGMEGAHLVLSSDASMPLLDVLGSSVISANPFLTGKDVAYVIDWAERKMRRRGSGKSAPVVTKKEVVRASPEFARYKQAITELVQRMTEVL